MKRKDIYVETLMKCKHAKDYLKDGNTTFIPEMEMKSVQIGSSRLNVEKINSQAIFIKVGEGYICLNQLNSFKEDMLVNMGFDINVIYTKPLEDGDLFVLEETLIPYFNENTKKDIYVGQLRKRLLLDPRIKSGIEH